MLHSNNLTKLQLFHNINQVFMLKVHLSDQIWVHEFHKFHENYNHKSPDTKWFDLLLTIVSVILWMSLSFSHFQKYYINIVILVQPAFAVNKAHLNTRGEKRKLQGILSGRLNTKTSIVCMCTVCVCVCTVCVVLCHYRSDVMQSPTLTHLSQ